MKIILPGFFVRAGECIPSGFIIVWKACTVVHVPPENRGKATHTS